jgi:hypothetical protein
MAGKQTPETLIESLDEPRRSDIRELDALIRRTAPSFEPSVMSGMLAYGRYRYRYASGREGEWCRVALASNKRSISLHVIAADEEGYLAERYRARLPKADIGKSCVRFSKLDDVDVEVLRDLIEEGSRLDPPGSTEGSTP